MENFFELSFFFIVIIFSAIIHEYSHGWFADRLGDPTARLSGRLTLNPVPHIDMVGTILLPAAMYFLTAGRIFFGYAKPVPVNPSNMRNPRSGGAMTAFAGPASNFVIALIFGAIIRFLPDVVFTTPFPLFLSIIVQVNLLLAVFNLVPIPPLDGSKILFAVLPSQFNDIKVYMEAYGWFFLLFFIFFFFQLIIPVIEFLYFAFTGQRIF